MPNRDNSVVPYDVPPERAQEHSGDTQKSVAALGQDSAKSDHSRLIWIVTATDLSVIESRIQSRLFFPNSIYKSVAEFSTESERYLVQHLHFGGPHLQEDVVGLLHGPAFGLCQPDGRRQADEPQAVAVTEQTAGPQRGVGIKPLGQLVGELDLLLDTRDILGFCFFF